MSGVGEALAGVAAAASFSQLVAYLVKTSFALTKFCQDIKNAPTEIVRVKHKVLLLHHEFDILRTIIQDIQDDEILSADIRIPLQIVLSEVDEIVYSMKKRCLENHQKESVSLKVRLRFVAKDRSMMAESLAQLQEAENQLGFLAQLLHMRISLAEVRVGRDHDRKLDQYQTSLNMITQAVSNMEASFSGTLSMRNRPSPRILKESPKHHYIAKDSYLRTLGIYGSTMSTTTTDNTNSSRVLAGIKLPSWMPGWLSNKAVSFTFNISHTLTVQNQVPDDLPFIKACRVGDVALITQFVGDDPEIVNCRTMCDGKTPLLLAIESTNVNAVGLLLDSGASPDMGDDDQILPVFAACGYTGQKGSSPFVQTPPPSVWIDMLKILVSHGASVHDIVGESTMTTMTLACDRHAPDAYISYLRLLKEEQYTEFDITDGVGKSALYNAIRDGEMAGAAIDLLAESGVRITRILPDGRTALHFAAEMARTAEILQSLMNRFPPDEINRLDQWGWSPLHYAVESYHDSAKKIAMLLKGGADPYCKSDELYQNGFHTSLMYERPLTPFQFASELLPYFPGKFESFAQHIESTRLLYIEDEEDSSMEYCDAVEALS